MSTLDEGITEKMMNILKIEETKTDLENLAVLSRVGMKVASAHSADLDADATSASSTALIDLGLRLSEATDHGSLKEIILHNVSGYSILMALNDEYIIFGGLSNPLRIAYYLGYLRELAKKLNILISGGEITEMALSLQEEELEKLRKQREEEEEKQAAPKAPSTEDDKAALDDLLGFLDDWEKEGDEDFEDLEPGGTVVGIPSSLTVGLPEEGETFEISEDDFGDLESIPMESDITIKKEPAKPKQPSEGFKVYDDEVPPVPLDDYTPMEIEDEAVDEVEEIEEYEYELPQQPIRKETRKEYLYEPEKEPLEEELPPLDELPSFDELKIPDFDSDGASEYEVDFILDEESEALDKALKNLGWDEDE